MTERVRVLILEDIPDDADLAVLELRRAGLEPTWTRVDNERDFVAALEQPYDLILADNNLPSFDGISALRRVGELRVDVPFIIVSGSIGEDAAVAAMQSGAVDYVLKDRMARLGQAARRALEQHRDRSERAAAEGRLRQLELLRRAVELVADLGGSLKPDLVIERIIHALLAAVPADVALLLTAGENDELVVWGSHDATGVLGVQRGSRLSARALANTLRADQTLRGERLLNPALRRSVAIPLQAGEPAAALMLLARTTDEPFTDFDVETLELIATAAAIALRNAQLFSTAESASRVKSEFLNMAAHELRTPLSVIAGYLSLLADGTLGPPAEAWIDVIKILESKSTELDRLVDSLLTAARLEAAAVESRRVELDLVQLAAEALRRAEPRARLLQATVLLDAPSEPVPARADPGQIARIIDNLVDNALTYAGKRPWVRISVSRAAEVEIEDDGPGIAAENRERVFERFFRANDPEIPPQAGTGLGLYIARELAQRNGGALELTESRSGRGARFVLRLEPAPGAAGKPAPAATEARW